MGTYDTDKLKESKGGFTKEKQLGGAYKAGLYQIPGSDDGNGNPIEISTKYDPLFGDVQSEAAVRIGYERVGDEPEGYNKETAPDFASESKSADGYKGLAARLAVLEEDNKKLRAERDKKAQEEAMKDKPLETQNETELRATAEAESVQVEGLTSKKQLREAIQKSRDEKEGE